MFAKLLKYEWRSNVRLFSILSVAALGVGVLGAVLLRLMTYMEAALGNSAAGAALAGILVLGLGFLALALVAYSGAVCILLMVRFYKNKFTDEGYLTFTLPVSSHQIFLSSLLNAVAWIAISACITTAAVMIALVFGTARQGLVNPDILGSAISGFREIFFLFSMVSGDDSLWVLSIVQVLVSLVYMPVMVMTCMTVGAVVAKKHKVLAAFGIYYALGMVVSTVTTVVSVIVMFTEAMAAQTLSFGLTGLMQILLEAALIVGGYFLSTYLMRHKLNLP